MGFSATLCFKRSKKGQKLVLSGESVMIALYCNITDYTILFDTAARKA